ncbi:hypothetical protein BDW59DRAFT_181071 [Aspergillus cavernicola]|uniref:Aminoglycoside phosphotransferase domain-containing protein n=1 Tax=Aspergillus cavernicola TaxID=176166 RepID=A0ABR4I3I5_9EURO
MRLHHGSPIATYPSNHPVESQICSSTLQAVSYSTNNFARAERHVPFNIDALSSVVCSAINRPTTDLASTTKLAEGGFNRVLQINFNDGYAVIARTPFQTTVPRRYAAASKAATLVLTYSPDPANPVGTEYIVLEKLQGTPLSNQWFTMNNKSTVKIIKQLVQLEKRFMGIENLNKSQDFVPLLEKYENLDDIVIGPTAQHECWYKERSLLDIDRGPSLAKRETEMCKQLGKPRLRELHQLSKATPLDLSSDHAFSRPTLRHPDFSPNNILINSSNEVSGIIEWQHSVILPLCLCAGIPITSKTGATLFRNIATARETLRNRLVHFYYRNSGPCPVQFSKEEMQKITNEHDQEVEKTAELSEMRDIIGIDARGWVADDENLKRAQDMARQIKAGLLEHSEAEMERRAVLDHFPLMIIMRIYDISPTLNQHNQYGQLDR